MAFDAQAFVAARADARTEDVRVPELADWFDEGEDAVWRVRSLTANEVARADAAKSRLRRETAFVEALASGQHGKLVSELQALLGRDPDAVEPDLARRIEMLVAGSVEPECQTELAVRLAEHFPVVFFNLTNRVIILTGQGSDVEKKPRSSGPISESAQP